MAGARAFRKAQLGQESTAGTNAVATALWRGMGNLPDNTEIEFLEEDVGILGGVLRTRIPFTGGELTLEGGCTFQQLPYIFQSSWYNTSPTTDASSGQIWTWTAQNASSDPIATTDLLTYTVEFGDNQQAEYMNYCFTREFNITGRVGEGLDISATMEGRVVGTTDFTTGISIPTIEDILFTKGTLYLDATSDTIGTTQVTQTLFGMDLNVTTGWRGYQAADGNTYFSFVKKTADEIVLNVTFEHNATAVTEKANWRNEVERALRLKFTGSALSTTDAGATYDTFTFIVDLWGKWESFGALEEDNGNDQVTGVFRAGYSSTAANKARFIVVNESATLP
jgi:hypothetical protein